MISPPPVASPVDEKGAKMTAPWVRWFSELYGQFSSLFIKSNAYIGDMGTEADGININGTVMAASLKVSDLGASDVGQFIMHRHSTTLEPYILGARSNTNDSSHAAVTAGMRVLSIFGCGTCGTSYKQFGGISIAADSTGTLNNTSSPGQLILYVTPNGAVVPATAILIKNDKSATLYGSVLLPSLQASTTYANDAAAAAGGVAVGQFYRNGSVVQIRVV